MTTDQDFEKAFDAEYETYIAVGDYHKCVRIARWAREFTRKEMQGEIDELRNKMRFVPETDRGLATSPNVSAPTEQVAVLGVPEKENAQGMELNARALLAHAPTDLSKALRVIEVLREALAFECGNRCAHQNPCNAREALQAADRLASGEGE